MRRTLASAQAVITAIGLTAIVAASADPGYVASVEKFRADREARLKADDGWLTVAGLFWLREGENRVGADPLNDIVLPEGSAPGEVGVFEYRDGRFSVRIKDGVPVTMNGQPVSSMELKPGSANALVLGDLTMFVHQSGDRYAIRLRDRNSRIRKEFTGCRWFPIDERFRVAGRLVRYDAPRTLQVPNILGDTETYTSPGVVEFTLEGQAMKMEAISRADNRIWFIFRDLTSSRETYPSARFLDATVADDGSVVLDFNQATNPPCAFNPFTTCPLPPEQNRLRVRVEAGEMRYHDET